MGCLKLCGNGQAHPRFGSLRSVKGVAHESVELRVLPQPASHQHYELLQSGYGLEADFLRRLYRLRYKGTSLVGNCLLLGPYGRPMLGTLWCF